MTGRNFIGKQHANWRDVLAGVSTSELINEQAKSNAMDIALDGCDLGLIGLATIGH